MIESPPRMAGIEVLAVLLALLALHDLVPQTDQVHCQLVLPDPLCLAYFSRQGGPSFRGLPFTDIAIGDAL